QTVGTMNFNPAANSYTIAGANTVTLDTVTGLPAINVSAGNQTISAPLALAKDTGISVAGGTSLTVSGSLTNAGHIITKTGTGTLTISGPQTHGVGAVLDVNAAGAVNLNSDAGNGGTQ